jgi:hypothetical protein
MLLPGDRGPVGAAGGRLFAMLGGISALGYAAAVLLVRSDYTPADFLRFFSIFFLLACVWGLTLWLAHKAEPARGVVLAGAVLFRLLLLPAGLSLETGRFQRHILYDESVWRTDASVLGFKLAAIAFDLAAVWLLMRLAGPGSRGTLALLAYAWNPLVVKEFAGAGRIDAILVCLLLATCAQKALPGGLPLGGAGVIHPAALLLAPPMFRRSGWRAMAGPLAAVFLAWPIGLRLPIPPWTFGSPADRLLPGSPEARLAVGALLVLAVAAWRLWRDDGSDAALHRYPVWVFGVLLLATPLFAPWRLTWLLPFAALELSWFWLALSGSMFLSYHAGLSFGEIRAVSALQFAMPLLLWIWVSRGQPAAQPVEFASGSGSRLP